MDDKRTPKNRALPGFRLQVEHQPPLEEPSGRQLNAAIDALPEFVCLDGPTDGYVLAEKDSGKYKVERRDYSGEQFRHFVAAESAKERLEVALVKEIFAAFAQGQAWPAKVTWRDDTKRFALEEVLADLLDDLDAIMDEHEEIGDSQVGGEMTQAIHDAFISPKPGFVMPRNFYMDKAQGNRKVRAALQRFVKRALKVAGAAGLTTPRERLDAFQNLDILSGGEDGGSCYNDYFGYRESP